MADPVALSELAERQYGVVARWQIEGVRAANLCQARRWERLTPTVLRLRGAPTDWRQRLMTGLLEAGPQALVSHRSAARLWNLPGSLEDRIEITRGGRLKSHVDPAVQLHRPRLLLPHHCTELFGFPVTSVARTLFDLAAIGVPMGRLATVMNRVCNKSPGTLVALHRTLDELAAKGRPGITVMRQLLSERPVGTTLNDSGLEDRFEMILRNAGLPPMERQLDLGGHAWIGRVDFYNRDGRLIAEIDSALFHTSPADRARDAARDAELRAARFDVVHVPAEHVWHDPDAVVRVMTAAYASRRSGCTDAGPSAAVHPEPQRGGAWQRMTVPVSHGPLGLERIGHRALWTEEALTEECRSNGG